MLISRTVCKSLLQSPIILNHSNVNKKKLKYVKITYNKTLVTTHLQILSLFVIIFITLAEINNAGPLFWGRCQKCTKGHFCLRSQLFTQRHFCTGLKFFLQIYFFTIFNIIVNPNPCLIFFLFISFFLSLFPLTVGWLFLIILFFSLIFFILVQNCHSCKIDPLCKNFFEHI